jgi:hypothetical protein
VSDVPDLDRLIEEHEVFRTNMRWNQRDAMFTALIRLQITALVSFCLWAVFGLSGLAGVPLVWRWACKELQPPAPRDPFRRYRAM